MSSASLAALAALEHAETAIRESIQATQRIATQRETTALSARISGDLESRLKKYFLQLGAEVATRLAIQPRMPEQDFWEHSTDTIYALIRPPFVRAFTAGYQFGQQQALTIRTREAEGDEQEPYLPPQIQRAVVRVEQALAQYCLDLETTTKERIRLLLAQAVSEGWAPATLARVMREEFDAMSRTRSETIARTEVLRAVNAGARDAYKDAGFDIEGKKFSGTTHQKDETLRVNFESDGPPLHPRCECTQAINLDGNLEWIAHAGACDECAAMDGKVAE